MCQGIKFLLEAFVRLWSRCTRSLLNDLHAHSAQATCGQPADASDCSSNCTSSLVIDNREVDATHVVYLFPGSLLRGSSNTLLLVGRDLLSVALAFSEASPARRFSKWRVPVTLSRKLALTAVANLQSCTISFRSSSGTAC